MTLRAFYDTIGGNYDETLRRIPREAMVLRFVQKYATDGTFQMLTDAIQAADWETAFRAAHTLKGVAQNLGFDALYQDAFVLTEALRGNVPLTDKSLYQAVAQQQQRIQNALGELEA